MKTATPSRVICAENLVKGSVILRECQGPHCVVRVASHGGEWHEWTVLDVRTEGGHVSAIVLDDDGEQQPMPFGVVTTVRIRVGEVSS